ncbi:hypothetical protein PMZ80_005145 [Knufia obscura]|uniref:Uncharacterized protein n=1 Tax=Knufia obscura TaxID=1635080 RepID=A0ABR0RPS5_9EURO|nr:hypothetical protein PMZ80_005145 [Knufia obscura]
MVHFHRPGKWRFSRPSVNDYSYEKASTSEDSLSGDERESFLSQESRRATSSSSSRFNIVTCVLLVFSSILNILLVGFIAYRYSQRGPANPIFPQSLYSPPQEALRCKSQIFSSGFGDEVTEYMGNSTAADEAWLNLYPRTVVKVPKYQADQLVNKTIPIAGDEEHFPVLISVFHELHCLDSIRHLYFGHKTGLDPDPKINSAVLAPHHIDHCFDSLRQTLMCGADITPVPYQWVPSMGKALGSLGVPHTCRDYDALLEWAMRPEHDIGDWDESIKPSSIP